MEFVFACVAGGLGFVILCNLASDIFLGKKERRDEEKLKNWR